MDVSVRWLRALASSLDASPEELAERLSLRAVPVDAVHSIGTGLGDVRVGRVVSARKHPDADRLTLCLVDAGGEPLDVVCGAPHVAEGANYPYVPPGGTLPGDFRIEARKIRGIVSHGMLCSERELGLGEDTGGILRLPDELEPGRPLVEVLPLPDARLEIDLTPNRGDLASHLGVARELAPGGVADVSLPPFDCRWNPDWVGDGTSAEIDGLTVHIDAPERCRRYLAAIVRGVRVAPSPPWLQARLRAAGARPINGVVDATNYVLLEMGQPLHAFDLARLRGNRLGVRAATDGEALTTLDGRRHDLDDSSTVIVDAEGAVALAGVMGGQDSEVTQTTTDVVIECAVFDAASVRHTSRAAGSPTDASFRFERGVDETALETALRRCVECIVDVAGGAPDRAAFRVGSQPVVPDPIALRVDRVRRILGLRLSAEQIAAQLEPIGFVCEPDEADRAIRVTVPGWRHDVGREIDLIEEVARRYGFDSFPDESRSIRPSSVPSDPTWDRRRRVRDLLEGAGFLEARGLPMVGSDRTASHRVELLLPLAATESALRTDLVPPLLDRIAHNFARSRRDVRLYEIGTVFARGETEFTEEVRAAFAWTGGREPLHWSGGQVDVDIWDVRGLLDEIAARLMGGSTRPGSPEACGEPGSSPPITADGWLGEQAFAIFVDDECVGLGGRIRDDALDRPPWVGEVFAAEFRLAAVRDRSGFTFADLPAFPAVSRDLALLVPAGTSARAVADVIRGAADDTLVAVRPFDVYDPPAQDAARSIAWRLVFRATDRTLTTTEVDVVVERIATELKEELDVRLRES